MAPNDFFSTGETAAVLVADASRSEYTVRAEPEQATAPVQTSAARKDRKIGAQGRTWQGVEYQTASTAVRAAVAETGLDFDAVYRRVTYGWTLERAATQALGVPHVVPTTWRGTPYPSFMAAAKAASSVCGISVGTISGRVNTRGWSLEKAATEPLCALEEGLVYLIRHKVSGKVYVGKTKVAGLDERIALHVNSANKGKGAQGSLHEAIRAEGIQAFDVSVLEARAVDAVAAEKSYIAQFNAQVTGYNRSAGGEQGMRPKRIKYQGKWHASVSALISKELGPDAVSGIHNFRKVLKKNGCWGGKDKPTDEVIARALESCVLGRSALHALHALHELRSYIAETGNCVLAPRSPLARRLLQAQKNASPELRAEFALLGATDEAIRHAMAPCEVHELRSYIGVAGHCVLAPQSQLARKISRALQTAPPEVRAAIAEMGVLRKHGSVQWHDNLAAWVRLIGVNLWRAPPKDGPSDAPAFNEELCAARRWGQHVLDALKNAPAPLTTTRERHVALKPILKSQFKDIKKPRRLKKWAKLQRAERAQPDALLFDGALLWLQEAGFPIPQPLTESGLLTKTIVRKLGLPHIGNLPLRVALRLCAERRAQGQAMALELDTKLACFGVAWNAKSCKYLRHVG